MGSTRGFPSFGGTPVTVVPALPQPSRGGPATAAPPSFAPLTAGSHGNGLGGRHAVTKCIPFLSALRSPPSWRGWAPQVPARVVGLALPAPEIARPSGFGYTFGQDPAIASEMGSASVRGIRADIEAVRPRSLAGRAGPHAMGGQPIGDLELLPGGGAGRPNDRQGQNRRCPQPRRCLPQERPTIKSRARGPREEWIRALDRHVPPLAAGPNHR